MKLRSYQQQAFDALKANWTEGKKRVVLVLPTGAGKTVLGSHIAKAAVARGKPVVWMAHRTELVDQAAAALSKILGQKVGVVQGDRRRTPGLVQVVSVQTLAVRAGREALPPASVVICDEGHHFAGAEQWKALVDSYGDCYFAFLTATPERGDGRPMRDVADVLIPTVQPSQLIDEGVLTPCEILAPASVLEKGIAADAAEAYQRWGRGKRGVIFAQSKEHARCITAQLQAAGTPAGCVLDDTPLSVRRLLYQQVRSGSVRVLVNVGVLTEGFDLPALEVCVLARKIGNPSLFVQMVGRTMRSAPGKASCLVIDLVGAVHAYGSPENDRHYSLDGDDAVSMAMTPAQRQKLTCPQCGSLRSGSVCAVCGLLSNERPPVPEVQEQAVDIVSTTALNRSEEASAFYIQTLHHLVRTAPGTCAVDATRAFRARYGRPPEATLLALYQSYRQGEFTRRPLPAWWPADVRDARLTNPQLASSVVLPSSQASAAE